MQKLKKNKGITLIALVITIIILIILAGISISIVFGQDGLIQKAKGGANTYTEKASEEYVALKIQEWKMENAGTGISLFDYFAKKALTGEVEIDESVQQTDENNIGIVKDGYISIIDKNGNIIETQKIGPRPTIDTSSIKVTLQDGTEIANNSQEVGTPLKIAFNTSMENGTITKVEPLTATVTTENGVTKVEYVTNGTDKQISFRIYGKVGEEEYILSKKISVANKYESVIEAESLLKAISDNEFENDSYAKIQVNGANGTELYTLHVYNIGTTTLTENTTYGNENDVGTSSSYAKNMVVLKVNGDLTINQDVVLAPSYTQYGGPKGFMIYVTGTLTNNGTIDNSHGAYAVGQDVYLWKNENGDFETVPAVANTTYNRTTGDGGDGSCWEYGYGGKGGKGTSYSGGTGGAGIRGAGNSWDAWPSGYSGSNEGGMGGQYRQGQQDYGGTGNPGGTEYGNNNAPDYRQGNNGTGGLLIVYAQTLSGTGNFSAHGTNAKGADYYGKAGASGGGSINIFYNTTTLTGVNCNSNGGTAVKGSYPGGDGKNGTISVGTVATGNYVELE